MSIWRPAKIVQIAYDDVGKFIDGARPKLFFYDEKRPQPVLRVGWWVNDRFWASAGVDFTFGYQPKPILETDVILPRGYDAPKPTTDYMSITRDIARSR